jgi:hypothetical protein
VREGASAAGVGRQVSIVRVEDMVFGDLYFLCYLWMLLTWEKKRNT